MTPPGHKCWHLLEVGFPFKLSQRDAQQTFLGKFTSKFPVVLNSSGFTLKNIAIVLIALFVVCLNVTNAAAAQQFVSSQKIATSPSANQQ